MTERKIKRQPNVYRPASSPSGQLHSVFLNWTNKGGCEATVPAQHGPHTLRKHRGRDTTPLTAASLILDGLCDADVTRPPASAGT